jgi:hypothetical protein
MRAAALALLVSCTVAFASNRPCFRPDEAAQHINKDVCISAHIYDVIALADGTSFLDVCGPETSDEQCRFSIVSTKQDQHEVGDLEIYRGLDVQIRGIVRPFAGRSEIVLSHSRQFHGGGEKFHPNPALLKGFSAEDHSTAFNDPGLHASHHRSAFHANR